MNENIYQKLKNKILFLELEPGALIDEKKLAAEFKVSRTPVREVLQKLEWEGFVDIVPRGTISVAPLEYTKVKNTYYMRVQVEGLAGKLAAAYGTPRHVSLMMDILEKLQSKKEEWAIEHLISFDGEFRTILYDATGNNVLKQMSDSLYEQTLRIWVTHIKKDLTRQILEKEFNYLIEEVNSAIEAVEGKDREKAEAVRRDIIIRHIKRANDYFMQEIEIY